MSYWNHRVVRFETEDGETYEIKEVYYTDKGEPWAYCDAAVAGDSLDEVRQTLTYMTKATTLPVLDETAFKSEEDAT